MSPTAVQGRADIRMRVAMPLDYEHIRSYSFSVSSVLTLWQFLAADHLHISLLHFHQRTASEGYVSENNWKSKGPPTAALAEETPQSL